MKSLQTKTNVTAPDAVYPYGNLKDNTGSNDGTPADKELLADSSQFIERMMSESGITANGLPDNVTNGFQIYEAFRKLTGGYKTYTVLLSQAGSAAPTVIQQGLNSVGAIVWTRTSTGVYVATLTAAFVTNKTVLVFTPNTTFGAVEYTLVRTDANNLRLQMTQSGSSADDLLAASFFEVRIYD